VPRTLRLCATLAVALLATTACGSDGKDAETPSSSGTTPSATASSAMTPTTPVPPPSGSDAVLPDDLRARPAVAAAIDDVARREGVDPSQVAVAAWSPVTWDDGSIGCPQKGRAYTQALVEGELLLLRVGTGLFQYHATGDGPFDYCANPSSAYSVTADG
jgi:pyruvate/2-oxoglutarate dehydrogenase complex dihydrolipoamide acyltransferase (E2) component